MIIVMTMQISGSNYDMTFCAIWRGVGEMKLMTAIQSDGASGIGCLMGPVGEAERLLRSSLPEF
jgi:hypothetical protein